MINKCLYKTGRKKVVRLYFNSSMKWLAGRMEMVAEWWRRTWTSAQHLITPTSRYRGQTYFTSSYDFCSAYGETLMAVMYRIRSQRVSYHRYRISHTPEHISTRTSPPLVSSAVCPRVLHLRSLLLPLRSERDLPLSYNRASTSPCGLTPLSS